jgi:hypothetical protein
MPTGDVILLEPPAQHERIFQSAPVNFDSMPFPSGLVS